MALSFSFLAHLGQNQASEQREFHPIHRQEIHQTVHQSRGTHDPHGRISKFWNVHLDQISLSPLSWIQLFRMLTSTCTCQECSSASCQWAKPNQLPLQPIRFATTTDTDRQLDRSRLTWSSYTLAKSIMRLTTVEPSRFGRSVVRLSRPWDLAQDPMSSATWAEWDTNMLPTLLHPQLDCYLRNKISCHIPKWADPGLIVRSFVLELSIPRQWPCKALKPSSARCLIGLGSWHRGCIIGGSTQPRKLGHNSICELFNEQFERSNHNHFLP